MSTPQERIKARQEKEEAQRRFDHASWGYLVLQDPAKVGTVSKGKLARAEQAMLEAAAHLQELGGYCGESNPTPQFDQQRKVRMVGTY